MPTFPFVVHRNVIAEPEGRSYIIWTFNNSMNVFNVIATTSTQ